MFHIVYAAAKATFLLILLLIAFYIDKRRKQMYYLHIYMILFILHYSVHSSTGRPRQMEYC